jgi:hypothetical protein
LWKEHRNAYLSHIVAYKRYVDAQVDQCRKDNRLAGVRPFYASDFPRFPDYADWIGRTDACIDASTFRERAEVAYYANGSAGLMTRTLSYNIILT